MPLMAPELGSWTLDGIIDVIGAVCVYHPKHNPFH